MAYCCEFLFALAQLKGVFEVLTERYHMLPGLKAISDPERYEMECDEIVTLLLSLQDVLNFFQELVEYEEVPAIDVERNDFVVQVDRVVDHCCIILNRTTGEIQSQLVQFQQLQLIGAQQVWGVSNPHNQPQGVHDNTHPILGVLDKPGFLQILELLLRHVMVYIVADPITESPEIRLFGFLLQFISRLLIFTVNESDTIGQHPLQKLTEPLLVVIRVNDGQHHQMLEGRF